MRVEEARTCDVAVIGAGSIGIAVAYYLVRNHELKNVVLIDQAAPMSLTSAQSGENYRNWWPHPTMTAFTNHSIALLEDIASETGNRINMTRRGYALVTRNASQSGLIEDLYRGYGEGSEKLIRIHDRGEANRSYQPSVSAAWDQALEGVDVMRDPGLIQRTFPNFASDVASVLHVRRAGSISGQQLGQFMLEKIREAGGQLLRGKLVAVDGPAPFDLTVETAEGRIGVRAGRLVNAAGPFLRDVAQMLGEDLPVSCVFQQKIAFEDRERAIPRDLPFAIDLDSQQLDWSADEREILAENPVTARLLESMPGGIHCRPDGAEDGKWIKLGWAFNDRPTDPHGADPVDDQFPDMVLRAASRLQPALKPYLGHLPRGAHHYGGCDPLTPESGP